MKKIINKILFSIIEFIEKKQYKSITLDQNNALKKITNIEFVDKHNLYVNSPEGWVKITEINETQPFKIWYVKTQTGKQLYCADKHILFDTLGQEILVSELNVGQHIITKDGFEKVIEISKYNQSNSMVDLTVDSNEMRYFTNDILSHNTITAAITLLHYAIFNKNKGIMVVANKSDTVIEILDKIKNIYKLLPFFLKPGLVNWNNKSIVFENGCRIKSQARSKEPAIGFTIDFLYMDEFAHIPPTIINHYYKAAVPTVSSITGSKIVITSTPNGANLFKQLVMDSLLPEGHPDKNMYKLIKVLWWQVPNGYFIVNGKKINGTRMDPKLYPDYHLLKSMNLTINDIVNQLQNNNIICKIDEETTDAGIRQYIKILHNPGISDIQTIREMRLFDMNITKLCLITNWQEEEEKLIGGAENFNQEYNIQFIAGAKRVLSAPKAAELENRQTDYVYHKIPQLDQLSFDYNDLKWHPDFNLDSRHNYYWALSVDTSEGLGQDYSVINLFRLLVRPREWFERNKITSLSDAFYLKQTAIYESNIISPEYELPDLFYILVFEYLKPERVKTVLELNGPGSVFLASLPNVKNQMNLFARYVFVKYFHKSGDQIKKIGLKVTRNKKLLVKNYITCIENDKLYVDEKSTLEQMDNFIKIETRGGDFTYKADSGNDDKVMTLVNGTTFFSSQDYVNMCQQYYEELNPEIKKIIDDALNIHMVNYNTMSYKSVYNRRRN